MKTATRYVSFVVVPLALGLFATARPALTLFVGQPYVSGSIPLMILTLVFALTIIGTALSPMLLALGETAASSLISIGSVGLSLTVAFALVPLFGMVGAAVARGLSLIATTGLTILFLRRKLSLHLDLEAFSKSIIAGGTMAVVVMALQIWFHSRFLLLGCVLVGGVTYLVMLRLLKAAQPRDVDLINKYFGTRLAFIGSLLKTILLPRQRTAA
jgi:O-antigen/teichoic acid export membrane protein